MRGKGDCQKLVYTGNNYGFTHCMHQIMQDPRFACAEGGGGGVVGGGGGVSSTRYRCVQAVITGSHIPAYAQVKCNHRTYKIGYYIALPVCIALLVYI